MDRLLDALTLQRKMSQMNCNIRVPLACIIDYKGFRGFVQANYNTYQSCKIDKIPQELQTDFDNLAKCLNLSVKFQQITITKFQSCPQLNHYLNSYDETEQTLFYLSDLQSLFPSNPENNNKFRAEFTYRYTQQFHPYNQDSLFTATKYLRSEKINNLIQQLEQLEILPIDSYTFKQVLHLNGINIAYIGVIAHETSYPHIQELCQAEMIARAAKKLLNSFISEYLLKQQQQQQSSETQQQLNTITTDFLALLLGQTSKEDTEIFFTQILRPQILHDFHYTLPYPHNVPPGGLYHALLWHCNLNQGSPTPTFTAHTKLYSQRLLPVLQKSICQQSLEGKKLQLQLANLMNCKEQVPHLITELSSIYFECEEYDNSQEKAKSAFDQLPQTCPFSLKPLILLLKISLKNEENFETSLQLFHSYLQMLDYTLGQFHPLHAFIYSTFSEYYMQKNQYSDALILKKSQVICCLRVLGNTHKITTEAFLSLSDCLFKIGQQDKACAFLEKAFANLMNCETEQNEQKMQQLATIANQIAASFYAQGKIEESINYSIKEVELLTQFQDVENIAINILEAELNIAFSSSLINNYDQCFEHIEKCWLIYDQFKISDSSYFIKILKVVLLAIFSKLNHSKKESILMFISLLQEAEQQNYQIVQQFEVDSISYLLIFCQKLQSVITFVSNLLYELIKKNNDNLQVNITIPNYNRVFWSKYIKIIEEADPLKVKELHQFFYYINFFIKHLFRIILLLYALMQTVGIDFFKENLQNK